MITAIGNNSPSFSGNVRIIAPKNVSNAMKKLLEENSEITSVANDGYDMTVKVLTRKALSAKNEHTSGTELFKIKLIAKPERWEGETKFAYFWRTLFNKQKMNLTKHFHSHQTTLDAIYNMKYWQLKCGLK